MSNFSLYQHALELCKKTAPKEVALCKHMETTNDSGRIVCLDCGQMLKENFLVDQICSNIIGMKKRKKNECSIYHEIPMYIPQHIKDITIDIYKIVTGSEIFRNTFRKSLILACLHRASILNQVPLYFDDMLEMFGLNTHEANKGISFVANNISKGSEYSIPFFNDEISIMSVLSNIGMKSILPNVSKIFSIIKKKSEILNNSHCKSVVCGSIYFLIKHRNFSLTLKQFAVKVKMSEMTIIKKYLIISSVMLKYSMKELFSILLTNCKPKFEHIYSPIQNTLYDPIDKLYIKNYKTQITVVDSTGFILPLDDVDDLDEWNMLLNKKYYDDKGNEYSLLIQIFENTRDILLDFKKYDTANSQHGQSILTTLLLENIMQK